MPEMLQLISVYGARAPCLITYLTGEFTVRTVSNLFTAPKEAVRLPRVCPSVNRITHKVLKRLS